MRATDKGRVLAELRGRVVDEARRRGPGALEALLSDSLYHETRRLKDDHSRTRDEELAFWRQVTGQLRGAASDGALTAVLQTVVDRYSEEICGKFDERVYDAVTRTGEPFIGLLLNSVNPRKLLGDLPALPNMEHNVLMQGHTEALHRLRGKGTLVLVPTHVSNMDSIAVGYAVWKLKLPPFLYGGGLNLFSNPLLGFFMRRLGAYTVDRRKQDPLYKRVLKEFCTLTLENGYDNIFFPGGTRSRAGAVERKLKLGLLGCSVTAYTNNLLAKKPKDRVFIVPATLSFSLVLEAETLIDDFLKEQGKSRYIISDDEFSKPTRVFDFMRQLLSLDSKIYFTVGQPMDPFGNLVDEQGESVDPRGRRVDPARFTWQDGEPTHDEQRDAEYTRAVGERLVEAWAKDTVIQSTHLTAHATLNLLRKANPGVDFVRLLRGSGKADEFELGVLYAEVDRLLSQLRGLNQRGGVRLSPALASGTAETVVAEGLRHFAIYHSQPAVRRVGAKVSSADRALLFYYSNRLEGYRLERALGLQSPLAANHRALRGGA